MCHYSFSWTCKRSPYFGEWSLSIKQRGGEILCKGMKINMLSLLGHEILMPYFVGA